ncbi:MAG: hypothetical protein CSB44_02040 [Gammaproteobacteria bacterium]|nr:MAG: hypothetical protein CSB44_02040 [Gammaproteobacteria bacterium]
MQCQIYLKTVHVNCIRISLVAHSFTRAGLRADQHHDLAVAPPRSKTDMSRKHGIRRMVTCIAVSAGLIAMEATAQNRDQYASPLSPAFYYEMNGGEAVRDALNPEAQPQDIQLGAAFRLPADLAVESAVTVDSGSSRTVETRLKVLFPSSDDAAEFDSVSSQTTRITKQLYNAIHPT